MKRLSLACVGKQYNILEFNIKNENNDIFYNLVISNLDYMNDPDTKNNLQKFLDGEQPFIFNLTDGRDSIEFQENLFIIKTGGYPYNGMAMNKIQFKLTMVELIHFKNELERLEHLYKKNKDSN